MQYITNALCFFVFFNLIYFFGAYIIYKIKKQKYNIKKVFIWGLLYTYILTLFSQTVLPYWRYDFDYGELIILPFGERTLNLIPFKTVYEYLISNNAAVSDWGIVSFINVLGNMALFMPIGFLISIVYKKSLKVMLLISGGISLFIEFVQYFISRVSDIDDFILNVLGACIGFAIAYLMKRYIKLKKM